MQPDRLERLNADEALLIEVFRNTRPENQAAVLAFANAARSFHVGELPTNVVYFPLHPRS